MYISEKNRPLTACSSLFLITCLSGCAGMTPEQLTQGASSMLEGIVPGITGTPVVPGQPSRAQQATQSSVPGPMALAMRPAARSVETRALFAKGRANGQELLDELLVIQQAGANNKTRGVMAGLIATAAGGSQSSGGFDIKSMAVDAALSLLKQQAFSYSNAAFQSHMQVLTGDPTALSKETIKLPVDAARSMTEDQRRSIITMAALVIAARVSHRMLDQANQEYAAMESDYEELIIKRQQTAALLADFLDRKRKAEAAKDELSFRQIEADMSQWLSADDLKFLDSFDEQSSVEDFSADLGVQNIALKFLKHADPNAYADYRVKSDGLTSRQKAYLHTAGGVAAFGGFAALFVQELGTVAAGKNNLGQIISSVPLAIEFTREAYPLVKLSLDATSNGISATIKQSGGAYRIVQGSGLHDVGSANKVYEAIDKAGDAESFADTLFQGSSINVMQRLYQCNPGAVGRLLDKSVSGDVRREFATWFDRSSDASEFTFENALSNDNSKDKAARLAEMLLARDQRTNADQVLAGRVQRDAAAHYNRWNNDELKTLIVAGNQGDFSHAQIQVGGTLIRLVPSMDTIYIYESFVDSCNAASRLAAEANASSEQGVGDARSKQGKKKKVSK